MWPLPVELGADVIVGVDLHKMNQQTRLLQKNPHRPVQGLRLTEACRVWGLVEVKEGGICNFWFASVPKGAVQTEQGRQP